ncbi:MAG: type II toxin-antitoxin system RelE/ParE family toxin [Flavobacteriaceae bacterium]|jgi:plasmid stabilization system protein ParE|nr:type II toxin-antitoxin system RelE/ParE family toxin [Flavobacteriaceae bacterium]
MKLEVVWSDFAESQLDKIFEYYKENASFRVPKNLVQKIIAEPIKLIDSPHIGQIEDLLTNRKEVYRYLICKNYKIIYSLDEKNNLIKIADIFDTRQNPVKIERKK